MRETPARCGRLGRSDSVYTAADEKQITVLWSLVANVIALHIVHHHQYADDTQLHLARCADNTASGLSILAACTAGVKLCFMQNGHQLNPDKSEALIMATYNQLWTACSLSSVKVTGVDLPVAKDIEVLRVIEDRCLMYYTICWLRTMHRCSHVVWSFPGSTIDRRLTFDKHVSDVMQLQHYPSTGNPPYMPCTEWLGTSHRCLLVVWFFPGSTTAMQCCMALQPAPSTSCSKYRTMPQDRHQALRRSHAHPLLKELHWLPVEQRISYSLAVLSADVQVIRSSYGLDQHQLISVCTSGHIVALGHCDRWPFCFLICPSLTNWHQQTII